MLPSRASQKSSHKTTPINGVSALKLGILYGANASGKSNLVKAIDFGKNLILKGTNAEQLISTNSFKLDKSYFDKPSTIEYEFQHKSKNYAYGFSFNSNFIIDEWLFEISKRNEKKIFERSNTLSYDLEHLINRKKKKDEKQFLEFLAKSTPRNQLFLTQIRNSNISDNLENVSDLKNAIDWFKNSLNIIYPATKNISQKFELIKDADLKTVFEKMLKYFDTGIDGIDFEEIDYDKIEIPNNLKQEIQSDLLSENSEKTSAFVYNSSFDKYYVISKVNNKNITAKILKTKHSILGGGFELFDIKDESDGTRRLMDLIPLLLDFIKGNNVFIVDEIERSLHPNLVKNYIELIIDKFENINSQLILTSHESNLLSQKLLRKDEIWFAVKNKENATFLHSLEDYRIRFDKEILKDYLIGRYKGVPKFGNKNNLLVLNE